jgi:tetratricopeptide (TPR) repeat protein
MFASRSSSTRTARSFITNRSTKQLLFNHTYNNNNQFYSTKIASSSSIHVSDSYERIDRFANSIEQIVQSNDLTTANESLKSLERETTENISEMQNEYDKNRVQYCKLVVLHLRARILFHQNQVNAGLQYCFQIFDMQKNLIFREDEYYFYTVQRIFNTYAIAQMKLQEVDTRSPKFLLIGKLLDNYIEHLKYAIQRLNHRYNKPSFEELLGKSLYFRGTIHGKFDQIDDGIIKLSESVQLFPALKAYLNLAFLHYSRNNIEQSLAAAEKAFKYNDPEQKHGIMILMAQCFIKKNRVLAAREVCEEIITEDSENMDALSLKIICNCLLHQYETVLKDIKNIDVKDHLTYYAYQFSNMEGLFKFEEAIQYAKIISEVEQSTHVNAVIHLLASVIEIHQMQYRGMYKQAYSYFMIMKYRCPPEFKSQLWSLESDIMLACGYYERAVEVLQSVSTSSILQEIIRDAKLAHALAGEGKFEEAETMIHNTETLLELNQTEGVELDVKYAKAKILSLKPDQVEEAIDSCQQVLEITQELDMHLYSIPLLETLAQLSNKVGRIDDEQGYHQQVLDISPHHISGLIRK